MTCTATKANGERCRARPQPGREVCLWHDPSADARARHQEVSRKGGETKAYGALTAVSPMADGLPEGTDLGTAEGGRALLSVALDRLAALPFDIRIAHALAQLVAVQRQQIETAELERRLAVLEKAFPTEGR